jgi:hypothetical protein
MRKEIQKLSRTFILQPRDGKATPRYELFVVNALLLSLGTGVAQSV